MAIHVSHASELCDNSGPTGELVEVLRGEIQDYGGNALFSGPADECVEEQKKYRIPTRRVPKEIKRHKEEIGGADNHWSYA